MEEHKAHELYQLFHRVNENAKKGRGLGFGGSSSEFSSLGSAAPSFVKSTAGPAPAPAQLPSFNTSNNTFNTFVKSSASLNSELQQSKKEQLKERIRARLQQTQQPQQAQQLQQQQQRCQQEAEAQETRLKKTYQWGYAQGGGTGPWGRNEGEQNLGSEEGEGWGAGGVAKRQRLERERPERDRIERDRNERERTSCKEVVASGAKEWGGEGEKRRRSPDYALDIGVSEEGRGGVRRGSPDYGPYRGMEGEGCEAEAKAKRGSPDYAPYTRGASRCDQWSHTRRGSPSRGEKHEGNRDSRDELDALRGKKDDDRYNARKLGHGSSRADRIKPRYSHRRNSDYPWSRGDERGPSWGSQDHRSGRSYGGDDNHRREEGGAGCTRHRDADGSRQRDYTSHGSTADDHPRKRETTSSRRGVNSTGQAGVAAGAKRAVSSSRGGPDYSALIPGYDDMSPVEKVKARMRHQLQQAHEKNRAVDAVEAAEAAKDHSRFAYNEKSLFDDQDEGFWSKYQSHKVVRHAAWTGADEDREILKAKQRQVEAARRADASHEEAIFGRMGVHAGGAESESGGEDAQEQARDRKAQAAAAATPDSNSDRGAAESKEAAVLAILSEKVKAQPGLSWRQRALQKRQGGWAVSAQPSTSMQEPNPTLATHN